MKRVTTLGNNAPPYHYNIKLYTLMTYKDCFNVKKTSSWVIQMSMKSVE